MSVTATSLWITGPLAADGAALAFATATMALVLRWRDDVTVRRAVWIGLGVGATVSVKALLAPVILPAALVLLAGRRVGPDRWPARRPPSASTSCCGCPGASANVWDQSYGYHLEVASDRTPGRQPRQGPQHDGRPRRHRARRRRAGHRRRRCSAAGPRAAARRAAA